MGRFLIRSILGAGGGGGSGFGPILAYVDTPSAPKGAAGVGEDDLGAYLRIYGWNFGTFADYVSGANSVTIGGQAIANYRYLQPAVGGVGTVLGMMCLCVQVGTLSGLANGTAGRVSVTVGGVGPQNPQDGSTNFLDADGNPITFTPNPGPIYFFATTGNDANAGTFASPKRHLQTYDGSSTFGGVFYGPVTGRNTSNQVPPGAYVVGRAGSYGSDTSFENRMFNGFRVTGTAPTGSSNTGYITITSYPGPAGANAPELVEYVAAASSNYGMYRGADAARTAEATPWGTTGYSKYMVFSAMKAHSHPSAPSDGAPLNMGYDAEYCRIVDMDLSMPITTGSPLAAGIAGYGTGTQRLGNYIHGVYDPSGGLQNHAIYIDNTISTTPPSGHRCEYHSINAYNVFSDISGGCGFNVRGPPSGQPADSTPYISIHHNWMDGIGKHGVNSFDGRTGLVVYDNVILRCQYSPISVQQGPIASLEMYFGFNTCYSWGLATGYPGIYTNASSGGGSIGMECNVFMHKSGDPAPAWNVFLSQNTAALTINYGAGNHWFDGNGTGTKPAGDTSGVQSDPQFNAVGTNDFTPASGSPLLDAGTLTPLVTIGNTFDLFGVPRPQGAATKPTRGALERVA